MFQRPGGRFHMFILKNRSLCYEGCNNRKCIKENVLAADYCFCKVQLPDKDWNTFADYFFFEGNNSKATMKGDLKQGAIQKMLYLWLPHSLTVSIFWLHFKGL